jgi:NAD(P)H-hydrate epimerase
LSRKPEGFLKEVIEYLNCTGLRIISVDIASGLYADIHTEHTTVVNANYTVAFQIPKLAFLLPENFYRVGEWNLVDIGLSPHFISEETTNKFYINENFVKSIYKKREKFSHKGTFGRALLIAGSFGKMGAAVLAANGCLRTGVGLLTVQVPKCGIEILQTSLPEPMVICGKSKKNIDFIEWKSLQSDAIGIGPGIGKSSKTLKYFQNILQEYKNPMVIDADAINILSENSELLNILPANSILTPHVIEFERLVGKAKNDFDRTEQLVSFAKDRKVFIILKGNHTAIATPQGELYFNSTGNPGMATGGSGDVLTGILTSLLAQKYSPLEVSILGVYIHGLAGDLAVKELGQESLIASDLVSYLGKAFLSFFKI